MKTSFFMLLFSFLQITLLFSQENNYQRNSLVREGTELTVESGLKLWMEDVNTNTLYNINVSAGIEYTILSHSIKVSLPYTISLFDNHEALNRLFNRIGDVTVSYEYFKQLSNLNIFFGPHVTIPLAVSNEYASREGVYATGESRYEAGLGFSISGIRDPVVWNLGLRYTLGLPKEERYFISWRPGTIQVSAGISDLFNDRFGYSLGISETFILPKIIETAMEPGGFSLLTGLKLETIILFEHDYFRLSAESYVYPLFQPVIIGITYGHNFKLSSK
jgi:hypothetical protein